MGSCIGDSSPLTPRFAAAAASPCPIVVPRGALSADAMPTPIGCPTLRPQVKLAGRRESASPFATC